MMDSRFSTPITFTNDTSHDARHNEYMLERAYHNIYGTTMPQDDSYRRTLAYAADQLCRDPRTRGMSSRQLLSVLEDMIRISDEHHERARKHLARASNPVYLRETALDKAQEDAKYHQALTEIMPGKQRTAKDEGRLTAANQARMTSAEMMELAYQQLALTPSK